MITDVNNDASKVCFLEHEERTMKGGSVHFKSVPIRITMSDGSKRPLFFVTDECFSWGLQEQSGYKLPVIMTNRLKSGEVVPTECQNNFLKAFELWLKSVGSIASPIGRSLEGVTLSHRSLGRWVTVYVLGRR